MGTKWTVEQRQAIDARKRNLLVSAAAGSGKTAVLVQRILSIVLDEKQPVDIDRLLVVTFTRAAAAEMRERIGNALDALLEQQPENVHLRKQMTLLHHAQICTIDSFCSYILHNYFYDIDLDPGFRVAEQGELSLMQGEVLEAMLEEQFAQAEPSFLEFVEYFATGQQDSNLEALILQLHTFAQSHPYPDQWLEECGQLYHMTTLEEIEQSPMGQAFTRQLCFQIQEMKRLCDQTQQLLHSPEGPLYYEEPLEAEALAVYRMSETTSWREWYEILAAKKSGRLVVPKGAVGNEEIRMQAEENIRKIRGQLKELKESFFFQNPMDIPGEIQKCASVVETLLSLTRAFGNRLFLAKKEKNVFDFTDLEHLALKVLVDSEGNPTETARIFRDHFVEIMIDEYQDSNLLQEWILTAVSKSGLEGEQNIDPKENNLFMVGDVKQSIYRFRQACPWLFTQKYDRYTTEASPNQLICLRKNFRSRPQVLAAANHVFRRLMQKQVGDIAYNEDAALYPGAAYEQEEKGTFLPEVLSFSTDTMPKERKRAQVIATEAKLVANRILELTDEACGLQVGGKEGHRARYQDIVILLRSRGQWADVFVNTLMDAGIPAYAESTTGFYKTREIQTVLQYLQLIDNQRQEIPLAAVLASPIGNFTSRELAIIKAAFPDRPFYECCIGYAQYGQEAALREKLQAFYKQLDGFRQLVNHTSIHEILWKLYDATGFYEYAAAMPGGEIRRGNLDMLIHQAVTFEKTSYKGLFHFLRFVERIQKYDIDIGESSQVQESMDAVRIMTIHKSKGLEFPIVFLSGLGKQFNDQDEKQPVVLHGESGIGVDAIDLEKRTKKTTMFKQLIKAQSRLENRAEEIRLLYVGMTRAKEKLILTVGHKEKDEIVERSGFPERLTYQQIVGASSMWQWLKELVGDKELFRWKEMDVQDIEDGVGLGFAEENPQNQMKGMPEAAEETCKPDATQQQEEERNFQSLLERLSYVYGDSEKSYNAKLSVSELKKRASQEQDDQLESEKLYKEPAVIPYLPKFANRTAEVQAVEKGTAYHKLLECMDYSMESEKEQVDGLLKKLVTDKIMDPQAAETIATEQIVTFLHSSIGQRMKTAALKGQLKREQPFVFGIPARELHKEAKEEERILIQGIIDAYFIEDGQLVIVDYKTDRVSQRDGDQKLLQLYQVQLEYYARALHQLTGLPVKAAYIYSFSLGKEILCNAKHWQ